MTLVALPQHRPKPMLSTPSQNGVMIMRNIGRFPKPRGLRPSIHKGKGNARVWCKSN